MLINLVEEIGRLKQVRGHRPLLPANRDAALFGVQGSEVAMLQQSAWHFFGLTDIGRMITNRIHEGFGNGTRVEGNNKVYCSDWWF